MAELTRQAVSVRAGHHHRRPGLQPARHWRQDADPRRRHDRRDRRRRRSGEAGRRRCPRLPCLRSLSQRDATSCGTRASRPSTPCAAGEATVFLEVHAPDRTLIIVGAGHVGQRLCAVAKLLDYVVVVLDPRQEMVSRERFPAGRPAHLRRPGGAPPSCARSARAVTSSSSLTAHQHDAAALRAVVDSPAAYVGMIGSANKVRAIFAQLADEGVEPELLARVHSPIGLDIGAETPAELALCIMAEIVAESYGKLAASAGELAVKEQPKEARTT